MSEFKHGPIVPDQTIAKSLTEQSINDPNTVLSDLYDRLPEKYKPMLFSAVQDIARQAFGIGKDVGSKLSTRERVEAAGENKDYKQIELMSGILKRDVEILLLGANIQRSLDEGER